jgi:hypothetical protein
VLPEARRDAPAAGGDREQRQRRADRIGERDRDEPAAHTVACHVGCERGQDGPAARYEDEAERRAEQETATEVAEAESRHERQRPLDPLAEARDQQRQREEAEQHRADLDLVLLVDPEQAPQPGAREQKGGEGRDEAGGDREGTAL